MAENLVGEMMTLIEANALNCKVDEWRFDWKPPAQGRDRA